MSDNLPNRAQFGSVRRLQIFRIEYDRNSGRQAHLPNHELVEVES